MRQGFWVRPFFRGCCGILVLLVAAVIAVFAPLASAQDAEPTPENTSEALPTPTPGSTWTLSGTVVNSLNGAPLRRVLVQVNKSSEGSTLTDAEGRFQFNDLPEGAVSLTVRKPGFFTRPDLDRDNLESKPFLIPSGSEPVMIGLVPAGAIAGTVTDENGEPVEGVRVRLLRSSVIDGRKQMRLATAGRSNEDGEFRISGLPPGTYFVANDPTQKPQLNMGKKARALSCYPATYYPNTVDLASATPIQVSGGDVAKADLSLHSEKAYSVAGIVTGYPNGQAVYFQVLNGSGDALSVDTQFDTESGRFEIKMLPAGFYQIHARSLDQHGNGYYSESPISLRAFVRDAHISMRPTLSLPLAVQYQSPPKSDQTPLEAPVAVRLFSPGSSLAFAPFGLDYWSGHDAQHTAVAIRNVEPGKYTTEFHLEGGWYVASASYGSSDLFRENAAVSTRPEPVEIALRNDGSVLSGKVVLSGNPARGNVLIINPNTPALSPTVLHTDIKGEFTIEGIAPGEYNVIAIDQLEGLEYTNPEVLQAYTSRAAHIRLDANEGANVSLELIHKGE